MAECKRTRLNGTVHVPLSPEKAFSLFTPEGMRTWRPNWEPQFHVPGNDTTESGTVFDTEHNGDITHWIVVECQPGRPIIYARNKIAPLAQRAGLVHTMFNRLPDGTTEVNISYDLTTVRPEANAALDEYAAGYEQLLSTWQQLISRAVTNRLVTA